MVHDTRGCRKDNEAELTRWEEFHDPFLKIGNTDVVAGGDNTGFIDSGQISANIN